MLATAHANLCQDYLNLCSCFILKMLDSKIEPFAIPLPKDNRFKDPLWTEQPCFDFIKQSYLLASRWAEQLVENTQTADDYTRDKARFYITQATNALSPSNFLLTNPEILKETLDSKGQNLVQGIKMLAEDIEPESGYLNIRRTDGKAFEVGKNIAITPGKVIYQNELMQLIQYEPATKDVFRHPLLIVPPWINKFYILDLSPEKSFVKWCLEQGHSVFIISWVNPGPKLAEKTLGDYAGEGIIEAIDVISTVTGQKEINALGYCIGGTLLAITLAYMAAEKNDRIKTASLLTTQVDFTYAGDLKLFINNDYIEEIKKDMKDKGFFDGRKMAHIFDVLRSNELIWSYMLNNYMKGKNPPPFDLMSWNADWTHIPAANHLFYLRECYIKNALSKGEMIVRGKQINLNQVHIPVYNLAARDDHIVPAESVFFGNQFFGGDVDYVLADSGHISGVINPPSKKKYQYWRLGQPNKSGPQNYSQWQENAQVYKGSWWTDWQAWIERTDAKKVPARKIGGKGFEPIEDAPGSYVKVKSVQKYSREEEQEKSSGE
ncbi:MAG: class I poly(R)-hydroxyalkanoic acid synthase [Alphaproteobacteria bacterium]|nr:class I poly(R)-hydroxyalkanoic acid synthase [Alphaproteobacteria bacterium]